MIKLIFIKEAGEKIEIRFKEFMDKDLFSSTIDRIKSIDGRKYETRDKDSFWTIPIENKIELAQKFDGELRVEEVSLPPPLAKVISDDITYLDEFKLPLYPFQILGVNYLCGQTGALLGDEMGLGKSCQILGTAYKLYRMGKIKKALIICPSALKYQWAEEIEKFLDIEKYNIRYKVVDGPPKKRVDIYDEIAESDILYTIINYDLILNDIDYLLEHDWDFIGLDEVHKIKNPKSKTFKAVKQLQANYTFGATGTPMQNKPDELYTIFTYLNPTVLGSWISFRSRYVIIGDKFGQRNMVLGYKNLTKLNHEISPYMIRRLKKDVAPELPEMIIKNQYVEMYPEQKKLSDRIWEDWVELVKEVSEFNVRDENGEIISKHPKSDMGLGMFTLLQEVADAPKLLAMSDSGMAKRYSIQKNQSPKLDELYEILEEFIEGDDTRKVVIFTQFSKMQTLIVEHISKLGKCETINGKMSSVEKQERIVQFKLDPEVRFFVATDAANYGINLAEASLLINFDLNWNPAVWLQRNARIHRINSTHDNVYIINLIARDSIDERILEVLYNKQDMTNTIIESTDEEKKHLSTLNIGIMNKLLKKKK